MDNDGFFEFMPVSFFSCNTINSTLILSEKNGTIQYISDTMGSFTPDHFKKHIRFYPVDDFLFTTTDSSIGLRVWDRSKEREIYRYPCDALGVHEYSSNGILGSVSPTGIKLYDLRSRYHTLSCTIGLPLGLKWDGEDLYAFNATKIFKYDLRRDSWGMTVEDSDIVSLLSTTNNLFYIKQSNSKYFLIRNNLDCELETVGCRGGVYKDTVYVYGNNEIKFYGEKNNLKSFKFVKNIENVSFGEFNVYLFGDKKLYIKEGELYCG